MLVHIYIVIGDDKKKQQQQQQQRDDQTDDSIQQHAQYTVHASDEIANAKATMVAGARGGCFK